MRAIVDADIFQHEYGNATDSEGRHIPWPFVQARVQGRIDKIMEETGADEYQLYVTSDDKSNFRYSIATIKPYKAHRPQDKPFWYRHIRNFLVDHRGAIEVFGQEADDAVAIEQYKNLIRTFDPETGELVIAKENSIENPATIICSRDKDLRMVPGWHFEWGVGGKESVGPYFINEREAFANFYCQLLTGDSVDNIPGLYGVGKSSKLLDRVRSCSSDVEMYLVVQEEYLKRFGSYWKMFLVENARLLYMRSYEDEIWNPPIDDFVLKLIRKSA